MKPELDSRVPSNEAARTICFLYAGAVGFSVDAALLYVLAGLTDPFTARLFSFLVAVLVTWRINAVFTFGHEGRGLLHYVAGQSVGMLVNYGVYSGAILFVLPEGRAWLLIALAVGSGTALVFNYLAMKHWIFKKGETDRE